jgi:hypothetical protein
VTRQDRQIATESAKVIAGMIPNGPTARDLREASQGLNEDLLLAIVLILERERAICGCGR